MSPRRLLALIAPGALLCSLLSAAEGARIIGSEVRGHSTRALPPKAVANAAGLTSSAAGVGDGTNRIINDGRGGCYGGALSARALCVRGGSLFEDQGPTDYSSTLKDQSRPWWGDGGKSRNKRKENPPLFAAMKETSASASSSGSSWGGSAAARGGRAGGNGADNISPAGWGALLALPVALLAGKWKENSDNAGSRALFATPAPAKAKPAAKKKAGSAAAAAKPKAKAKAGKPNLKPAAAGKKQASSAVAQRRGGTGKGGDGGSGGIVASVVGKLIPDNPYLRGLGIIALAAIGTGGLKALSSNNLLRASWPITFVDPWQVLTAFAWAINMRSNSVRGRLDGTRQATNSGPKPVRFFSPAGWAFAIWAPIFLGEAIFVAFQLLPLPSIRGSWWLSDISPWFSGAMLFQTLWCFSFRPWARDSGLLWLPALLLGGVALSLGGAHGVLREAWFADDMTLLQYLVVHVPLSLHFGWISCATLVNLNGYFASIGRLSNGFKLGMSLLSILAAVLLGAAVTIVREDPIYMFVIAWALWAVGSPSGWDDLRGRVDTGAIRAQQGAARAGAVITAATAASLVGLSLKDMIVGVGGGDYDEDY